ncbi:paraquat-inducible protein A [uncultured Roseobacter sp.]|uniref:paraquat-inducible protein A n=1 Tax=uncultured Roseobacter sp. TaxID=114847 RepID=UPI00262F679B|nr:paraquat-inducible protein A [uncultured Roseobacter sp.]
MNETHITGLRTDLIVCPQCDAAWSLERPDAGQRAVCGRCGEVLIEPRRKAGKQIIALSLAIAILILAAALFPFLTISVSGATNSVSVLQAALAFSDGPLVLLSLATAALIVFIPLARVLLSLYVLIPIVRDQPPARYAAKAFRLSEALRPWSMAEIFVIGCAVALIKISDLAEVSFGPAFWMFSTLVLLVVVNEAYLCRWSVWNALNKPARS